MNHTNKTRRLAFLLAGWAALWPSALAQVSAQPTLYQITSGAYMEMGGIWGVLRVPLPNPEQTFVALTLDAPGGARLSFLQEDRQTVSITLTNGVVSGAVVRFQYQTDHVIYPNLVRPATVDYVVTNQNQTLSLQGAIEVIDPPCCDIPSYFSHTNLVAVALPELEVRVSELELCWATAANVKYQVQCSSEPTANQWKDLGVPVVGTGSTLCVTDKVLAGQPHRYYRITPVETHDPGVNHPPETPAMLTVAPGSCAEVPGTGWRFSWSSASDPDGDPVHYEYASSLIACGCMIEPWYCGPASGETTDTSVTLSKDYSHAAPPWFRVRAVDSHGAASDWAQVNLP